MTGEVKKVLKELDGNGKGHKDDDKEDKDHRKEFFIQKYTNGALAEAVLVKGLPLFLQVDGGQPVLKEKIELPSMTLKPLDKIAYLNKPYEFDSIEEIKTYIQRAQFATIDSLYQKTKAIWAKYIDGSDDHITICAADTLFTYFQDKMGMTHYSIFVGDNDTGKSNNLVVFQYLGYRPLFDTSITPANIYTYLGSIEEGQGILLEDEADNIDESQEKMRIYKVGYRSGTKVSRIDTSHGRSQASYWTYCFKAMSAEKQPDSTIAKGFNERTFVIQCRAGNPQYDIAEVINHGGEANFKALMDEIEELRKLLLVYRLLHFEEIIPDVQLNIKNREKQLCKPLIRLFNGSKVLQEVMNTLGFYLSEKRERKGNTLEAKLYSIIADLIKEREGKEDQYTLTNEVIWMAITNTVEGSPIPSKPQSFETTDFGVISQKQISELFRDKFQARRTSVYKKEGDKPVRKRALMFDKETLDKVSQLYSATGSIEIVNPQNTRTLPGLPGTLQADSSDGDGQRNRESEPITSESP